MSTPIKDHVQPKLSPARAQRQWSAISDRVQRRRAQPMLKWMRPALPVALVVLAVAGILFVRGAREAIPSGTSIIAGADASRSLVLADESLVKLAAAGELRVVADADNRQILELDKGRARFQVTRNPERTFTVRAPGVEVEVVGTEFDVSIADDGSRVVLVDVWEGLVRVRRTDGPPEEVLLRAGEVWSSERREVVELEPSEPQVDVEAELDVQLEEPPPVREPVKERSPPTRRRATVTPQERSAELLFRSARKALLARKYVLAAREFDALRRRYPKDSRAALAALELGRLKLDHLKDPRGAVEALESALRLAQLDPSLNEDIEARLVQAFEASGAKARCLSTRNGYLARYPNGTHRVEVQSRCR